MQANTAPNCKQPSFFENSEDTMTSCTHCTDTGLIGLLIREFPQKCTDQKAPY